MSIGWRTLHSCGARAGTLIDSIERVQLAVLILGMGKIGNYFGDIH